MKLIAKPYGTCHDSILIFREGDLRVFAALDIDFFWMPNDSDNPTSVFKQLAKGQTVTFELTEVK